MTGKIFRSIVLAAAVALFASAAVIMGALYEYFGAVEKQELSSQLALASAAVEDMGAAYLEKLPAGGFRLTWIGADGGVKYDSRRDADSLENHAQREEVAEALETGTGKSHRYSATLTEKTSYFAMRLTDGSVLRISSGHATAAVLAGGVFNVFGDYFFVFTCDMGVFGAGLATAIGSGITFTVMLSHFFSRRCTLRPVRFRNAGTKLRQILTTGFSTFFLDIAMGILTMLFNRQILQGLGTDALAVYGVIVNVSTMVQCCAYSVGQAAQPILSACFGAGKWGRIRAALKYALMAAAFFSAVWTLLVFLFPNGFIRIFMSPTGDILRIAPAILRSYGVSFLLLPLNIFSTYYFQSLMKPRASFSVSVLRGLVLSGALIYALPALLGPGAVWFAMPVTEAVTAVGVCVLIVRYTRPAPQTPE